jgi:hypothetical protein
MLKKYITILMSSVVLFSSCLKEDPPFVNDDLYDSQEGVETALNGIYSGFTDSHYLSGDYHSLVNLCGGTYRSSSMTERTTINKLNMPVNGIYVESVWQATYKMIERTNTFIQNVSKKDNLTDIEKNGLAQAYFLRAFNYFIDVRVWGDIPLRLTPAENEYSTTERVERKHIYEQIIKDAQMAIVLFEDSEGKASQIGRPGKYAARMLLSKVYMTLATVDVDNAEYTIANNKPVIPLTIEASKIRELPIPGVELYTSDDCWKNAFIEADAIYQSGKFSLEPNYEDLWYATGDNSIESIFEIQMNVQSGYEGKIWTPKDSYKGGLGWSRIGINPEWIKLALEGSYSKDPRYKSTFMTNYHRYGQYEDDGSLNEEILFGNERFFAIDKNTGKYTNKLLNRVKKNGYPFNRKYAIKDFEQTTSKSNQNMVLYRYADVLLMLTEISVVNRDEGLGIAGILPPKAYLNEVLERARQSKYKDLQTGIYIDGDGESPKMPLIIDLDFIMKEYLRELTGEGEDFFILRRRGREWFNEHIVKQHNRYVIKPNSVGSRYSNYTVIYGEDLLWDAENDKAAMDRAMYMPIPYSEITTNTKISSADQNDGY